MDGRRLPWTKRAELLIRGSGVRVTQGYIQNNGLGELSSKPSVLLLPDCRPFVRDARFFIVPPLCPPNW